MIMIQNISFFKIIANKSLDFYLKMIYNVDKEVFDMLKSINIKNFRSFSELNADFTSSNHKPKKLVMIYGENGSGKSNFMASIAFLKNTLNSLSFQQYLNKMIENNEFENNDENTIKKLISIMRSNLHEEIKLNKMIGSEENMVLEFNYVYDRTKDATYKLEFSDEGVIYESLYCQLEKNLVKSFEISDGKIYFNNILFKSAQYEGEIKEKVQKYFGKHTFLSIIFNEFRLNNKKYINKNISKSFLKAINELNDCSVWCKYSKTEEGYINTKKIMRYLAQGYINKNEENDLLNIQEALNNYFICLYSDIKGIHYKLEENNNHYKYTLFFDKLINGKIRSIPSTLESTGTLKLLDIFPYIYKCISGGTVFIDEIDSGVHDLLMNDLLVNIEKQIKGQLIITTHNTMLLKNIKADFSYVINVDIYGNKNLNCIKDFGRIQNNHNVSTRYLNGIFGGIPQAANIDLQEIMSPINGKE